MSVFKLLQSKMENFRNLRQAILAKLQEERGSAVVEFVMLALPLFVPLFIFLNNYATASDLSGTLQGLSREMARAVVTAENDNVARRAAYEVFVKGGEVLGLSKEIERGEIRYEIICRNNPCISPDNEVQIAIASARLSKVITSIEYVSPWA
jgi:hypothetical protein